MKFLILIILSWLTGNVFLSLLIFLGILYFLDRRFVGIFPSFTKPFRRTRQIARLKQQLTVNAFDVSSKRELARLLLDQRKFKEAYNLLQEAKSSSESSAEFWSDLGEAQLGMGQLEEGEQHVLQALAINERVKYGQPYLSLAFAFREKNPEKALQYAKQFGEHYSSSSEAYYLLGSLYQSLNRTEEAKRSWEEAIAIYRSLPRYKKRDERKWAWRSYFKKLTR
ncbi:tetratricopeptide repeat protein [Paenibacillus woosongensis]|uniref:Tetratricopeptide repeat protein n=1 Tax=Paenibacillus woosongensis TaxID=307580 RepID=A0AA95IAG0_9BACL|nr:tetratricopeptide repeat protein [Paenibacillus woosongensis]WHX51037.1 tetratricopeptide repeat protein [Paenibacillus woosongensis]